MAFKFMQKSFLSLKFTAYGHPYTKHCSCCCENLNTSQDKRWVLAKLQLPKEMFMNITKKCKKLIRYKLHKL